METEQILQCLKDNEKNNFGFYAVINGKTITTLTEYENYMKSQFYIDSKEIIEDKCKKMLEDLNNNLINNLRINDKKIKLDITIDKSGYFIKTNKTVYGEEDENGDIIKRYKKEIKDLYKCGEDNETCHGERDEIAIRFIKEIGYNEIATLLEKVERDIGFWYS